ncbi:DUF6146 family protein [Flavobacterium nackdongense]|uniref:Lipoprotein n=1 Tax=Flavobacterium nackdongense TaxID=2547394 RepID=A0A4P6Y6W3_9FLAO|nr:DUF6146 family protein [Flavobacterium nackdongense]QBN18241.1 hypothetical protein E1750_05275 [Flavobacterium nackdongense]
MKNYFYILTLIFFFILSCNSPKSIVSVTEKKLTVVNDTIKIAKKDIKVTNDTIRIANDSLEYEVIIIDPGFSMWIASRSFPRGYHSQSYLETKNIFYINEWNNRVVQPQRYNPNLYEMRIDYDQNINYGYEVNYLIYNYMIYFQNTYNQRLYGIVPPR